MVSALASWWNQPDRFDGTTRFLAERGLLRLTQRVMAVVAASAVLVPASDLITREQSSTPAFVLNATILLFTAAMAVHWLTRWPSRGLSMTAVVIGILGIAGWSTTQPDTAVAALSCTTLAITGGYIAFFHGPKLMVFNLAATMVISTIAAVRLGRDNGLPAAFAASWLIWFLNVSVPLVIWGTSRAMERYAARADEDPLTGLLNRRGFIEVITRQLTRPAPDRAHLAVQLVDLDDFKRINDTDGHAAGDRVLTAVAELLRRHAPPGAPICRAGGEEFLIASVTAHASEGADIAARLCAAMSELSPMVTASIGSVSAALDGVHGGAAHRLIVDLIEAADTAMYAAKRNGGNQFQHL